MKFIPDALADKKQPCNLSPTLWQIKIGSAIYP